MAYTKIHGIKATVNKAISYICDPDKTDDGKNILISSFACSPETAVLDFKYTLDHANEQSLVDGKDKENKAFHMFQSFAPGEVSFEQAHAVGKKLADRVLEGKYSYVIATHIDKEHIHNHIIFCAVDNINHNHYHDCRKTYSRIRNLNDQLCKEHGLSVIKSSKRRSLKYNKWSANQSLQNLQRQLRKDINQSIKYSSSYDEFLTFMKAKGYEIKNSSLGEDSRKYISFKALGSDAYIRGRASSMGGNYTKEKIFERIKNKKQSSYPNIKTQKIRQLIDLSLNTTSNNIGFQKWATKENLKIAAKTFSLMTEKNINTFAELNDKIKYLQNQIKSENESFISLEHRIKDISETIKYAEQYKQNKPIFDRYENAKDQDHFFRKYESNIILFSGAERMLEQKEINPKHFNIRKLKEEYTQLLSKKDGLELNKKSSLAMALPSFYQFYLSSSRVRFQL